MDEKDTALDVEYRLLGRSGRVALVCWHGEEPVHQATIDLSGVRHPERVKEFIAAACTKLPAQSHEAVRELVERRISEAFSELVAEDSEEGDASPTQATELVAIANGAYLFRSPGSDPEAYATVTEDGRRHTWPVASMGFRRWLTAKFYLRHEKAPGGQAIQDAVNTIIATAMSGPNVHQVHLRLAQREGEIWLDLADDPGRAVRLTSTGWEVVEAEKVPVAFIRRRGTLPLPIPARGGYITELRELINAPDEDSWCLIQSWLIAALRPGYPFPILNITGEQGSAKSTTTRVLRRLIDPHQALIRMVPREVRDLCIAAANSWVVPIDNLSYLPEWLSDALCVIATGGGFSTRQLYTDDEEKIFNMTRPLMLNSIADVVERSDLIDRAISICLPRIKESARSTEQELWSEFERRWARVLGSLLDAVVTAQRELAAVNCPRLPRLADFARWAIAAEPALDIEPGRFLRIYEDNRAGAHVSAVETSTIGPALLDLLSRHRRWEGTSSELLEVLDKAADDRTQRRRDWPRTPRALSGQLRRLAPNLRQVGVEVIFVPRGRRIILAPLEEDVGDEEEVAPDATAGRDGRRHAATEADVEADQEHLDEPEVRI